MTDTKYLAGSGGGGGGKGGGGGSSPTEKDDSLQSKQFATVLDLLCEGEIEGLDDGNKSIFFDNTPLEDDDGNSNFKGFTIRTRNGTQGQSRIINRHFDAVESEFPVNVFVTKNQPLIRQITDSDVDLVRVTIQIPSLVKIEDDGDIKGTKVKLRFDIQYNGGGYTKLRDDTISGKSSGPYQRDYEFEIDGAFPVDIKVTRITDDSDSSKLSNSTKWSSYTQIVTTKLRYPNSALVALRFNASQFNAIPQRKYLIRGIKVKIPSNATVDTQGNHIGGLTYTGIWDGSFKSGTYWTSDPAWCLWDLLTDDRYGCGIPESSLDRYDFYAISQYCNELVPDGQGRQERRFSCNLLINQRREVFDVIREMTSIFRGISYYAAGSLVLLQDRPSDPQYTLGPANVVNGVFSYQGSSLRTRHTCATVSYQTYEEQGEVAFEYVEDSDAVAKYGVNNKEIKAVGCYSQGQAHRIGEWALLSEQELTETCTFSVGIDSGIILRPGMVVDIADPLRGGTRRNGRVASATTTAITIDSDTDLSINVENNPKISVVLPSGLVETRNIAIDGINGKVITVTSAFSQAPAANAHWLIQTSDIQSQQFRVISVTENDDGAFSVTALKYNKSIYNAVDKDRQITQRDITNLSARPNAPTALTATEFLYQDGGTIRTGVDLGWTSPRNNLQDFVVRYRLGDDNFQRVITENQSLQIKGLKAGSLQVQVSGRNSIGRPGKVATQTFELLGKTAIPGNVQNLTLEPLNYNSARLRWDETVDLDVKVSGKVHIRHSTLTDGTATWSNSTDVIASVAGAATEAIVPLLEGEYLVKFEDDGGRRSATEASIIVDQPAAQTFYGVITQREDQLSTPFSGTKTDTTYDSSYDALILTSAGITAGTGEYAFASTLDLEDVYSLDLERVLVARGFYPSDTIDNRTADIDTWDDFDGGVVDFVNAQVYVRKTDDDPSGTPTYSAWQPLVSGLHKARAFQFKAVLTSADPAQNIQVDELGYKAQLQQRTEGSNGFVQSTNTSGGKAITFANPFFTGTTGLGGVNSALPTVTITPHNMASNDYFVVNSLSRTGFTVEFFHGSTTINRNFMWSATGFGKAE